MRPHSQARGDAFLRQANGTSGDPLPGGILVSPARQPGLMVVLRAAAALGLGATLPLALAPLHLLPALFLSFGGLFLLLERTPTIRGAFGLGWLFGLGSFVVGLGWITEAFAVDAERFGALALPALFGLGSVLALFPASSLAATRGLVRGGGWPLLAAFTAFWAAGEWLRGVLLTGFPWNLAGTAWGFADAPLQLAAVIGLHGLGLLTVTVAALPALVFGAPRRAPPLIAAAVGLALLWGFGLIRLATPLPPDLSGVRLRLVQPDVAQTLKWAPEERERILAELVSMTGAPASGENPPTVVIWPETAVPYLVAQQPEVRAVMAAALPPGAALVTGAVRRVLGDGSPALRNSILALDGAGTIVAGYDKIHLVPFGEYVPLRWLLSGIPKLTVGAVDFTPGDPRAAMSIPGAPPAWPLVCYEAIFPHRLPAGGERPGWILTVTNDAWFGTSWGPHQHALAARLRAVELGLPLVRAANSGVSFVADAYGRVRGSLALGTRGVLDAALPAAVPGGTFYAQYGDIPFGVAVLALLTIAACRRGVGLPK